MDIYVLYWMLNSSRCMFYDSLYIMAHSKESLYSSRSVRLGSLKQSILFLLFHLRIANEIKHEEMFGSAFAFFLSFNVLLVFVAALPIVYGSPIAAGSGVSEIKSTLNGRPGFFTYIQLV